LMIENFGNVWRKMEKLITGMRLSPARAWWGVTLGSTVCEDFGRRLPRTTTAARSLIPKGRYKLPKSGLFKAEGKPCTLSDEQMTEILQAGRGECPLGSPKNLHLMGLATQLLVKTEGSWEAIKDAFYSLIFCVGSIVHQIEEQKSYLVTSTSPWGATLWQPGAAQQIPTDTKHKAISFGEVPRENPRMLVRHITLAEEGKWKTYFPPVLTPGENDIEGKTVKAVILAGS
jgi:hypothetical protein